MRALVVLMGLCGLLGAAEDRAIEAVAAEDAALASSISELSPSFVFIGGGSGVVISAEGHFLTNHHVSGDQKVWTVRVDGELIEADLVGMDPLGDLALYRLRAGAPHPHVELGASDSLAIGDAVVALGNPFGAAGRRGDPSVTVGRVTAKNRFMGSYGDALQTDAALNPGNSGGPLLDAEGRLVGINGRIATRHGGRSNTGIGHAIPVDQIRRFLPDLKAAEGGAVYHALLRGLRFGDDDDDTERDGAEVDAVDPDTTASAIGLQAGDRIVAVDGRPTHNAARMRGVVFSLPGGTATELTVIDANGDRRQVPVVLDRLVPGVLDLDLTAADGGRSVVVEAVPEGGAGAMAGFEAGDRLVVLDGVELRHALVLRALLGSGRYLAGDRVVVQVERAGKTRELEIELQPAF